MAICLYIHSLPLSGLEYALLMFHSFRKCSILCLSFHVYAGPRLPMFVILYGKHADAKTIGASLTTTWNRVQNNTTPHRNCWLPWAPHWTTRQPAPSGLRQELGGTVWAGANRTISLRGRRQKSSSHALYTHQSVAQVQSNDPCDGRGGWACAQGTRHIYNRRSRLRMDRICGCHDTRRRWCYVQACKGRSTASSQSTRPRKSLDKYAT